MNIKQEIYNSIDRYDELKELYRHNPTFNRIVQMLANNEEISINIMLSIIGSFVKEAKDLPENIFLGTYKNGG